MILHSKIAGISFEGRQSLIQSLSVGVELFLQRQPDNFYDKNAIKILTKEGEHLGFINRELAEGMAYAMDNGNKYRVQITDITGSADKNFGVNIEIEKVDFTEYGNCCPGCGRAECNGCMGEIIK